MNALPKGWELKTLGDACEKIASGGTPSRKHKECFGGKIPWVVVKDIKPLITETSEYLTEEGLKNSSAKLWPTGTVILSTGATVGKVGIAGVELCTKQGVTGLVPKRFLDNKFLAFYLSTITEELKRGASGVTVKEIYKRELRKIKIPIPPLETQKKIVAILERAEGLKRKSELVNQLTNGILQSVFLQMFGDPQSNPFGWEMTDLSSVCTKITDGTHQPPKFLPSGIPFLFVSNIVKGEIDFLTKNFISEETYRELTHTKPIEEGDILYSTVGSYGVAVLVETDKKFAFQRHIGHIKPNKHKINPVFLQVLMNTPFILNQAHACARGVAQKTLNLSEIRKFRIILPPHKLQDEFSSKVMLIKDLKRTIKKADLEITHLASSLQSKAFKGELVN